MFDLKTKMTRIGNEMPAKIELNDTYLEINKVIIKTTIAKRVGIVATANTIPVIVATPFPPLKLAKMGNM